MFKYFKDFIMRGNALDLAVAVIIGAAFGKVITSRTNHEGLSILLIYHPDQSHPIPVLHFTTGSFLKRVLRLWYSTSQLILLP